jgi:hypothetical protein
MGRAVLAVVVDRETSDASGLTADPIGGKSSRRSVAARKWFCSNGVL